MQETIFLSGGFWGLLNQTKVKPHRQPFTSSSPANPPSYPEIFLHKMWSKESWEGSAQLPIQLTQNKTKNKDEDHMQQGQENVPLLAMDLHSTRFTCQCLGSSL